MNHSALSIAIVITLGISGCAGAGVRQGPSLPVAGTGSASPELGSLWSPDVPEPRGLQQTVAHESVGSDLWNPAEVARSWEVQPSKPEPRGLFSRAHTDLKF